MYRFRSYITRRDRYLYIEPDDVGENDCRMTACYVPYDATRLVLDYT